MKKLNKNLCLVSILLTVGNYLYAQSEQSIYLGTGIGFDYGGIGGKIEYLPVKHFGVFGGLGYNLLSLGWNVGATYKIFPDKKVSPNLMAFYGYNAVFKGIDSYAAQYNMTSYWLSIGGNLDILIGRRGNKLSVGLFVPVRSSKFMDNYDRAKADRNLEMKLSLLPIGISVGYNFHL
jgi:hypothetical protein